MSQAPGICMTGHKLSWPERFITYLFGAERIYDDSGQFYSVPNRPIKSIFDVEQTYDNTPQNSNLSQTPAHVRSIHIILPGIGFIVRLLEV